MLPLELRKEFRSAHMKGTAIELRNKLNEIGIVLQDTPQGVKWSKQ